MTRTHILIIFLHRKDDQISLITNKKAKRTNFIRIKKYIKIGRSTKHGQMFSITQCSAFEPNLQHISNMVDSEHSRDQMNSTFSFEIID